MLETSVYVIDCHQCGAKIQSQTLNAACEKCGLEIRVESWQIRHTLTAEGLLIQNSKGLAPAQPGKRDAVATPAK